MIASLKVKQTDSLLVSQIGVNYIGIATIVFVEEKRRQLRI